MPKTAALDRVALLAGVTTLLTGVALGGDAAAVSRAGIGLAALGLTLALAGLARPPGPLSVMDPKAHRLTDVRRLSRKATL
jgi:hypothetical protein